MMPVGRVMANASFTSRTFGAALRFLPSTFPAADARELAHIYEALDAEARRTRGWTGAALTLARELPGLLRLVTREHASAWRARRVRRDHLRRGQLPLARRQLDCRSSRGGAVGRRCPVRRCLCALGPRDGRRQW